MKQGSKTSPLGLVHAGNRYHCLQQLLIDGAHCGGATENKTVGKGNFVPPIRKQILHVMHTSLNTDWELR